MFFLLTITPIATSQQATFSTFQVAEASATENTWKTMASMPTALTGLKAAVANGRIYVIGHNITYEYNPAGNVWVAREPMLTPRRSFGMAVYQNKIYVIGGNLEGGQITGANEVYNPLTDTWETKTSMPTPRAQLDANAVNGRIYMMGGRTGGPDTTVVLNEVYNPATDTWATQAAMLYPVVMYASAVVGSKIYVIGGQDEFYPDSPNVAFNQIYDCESNTWSLGAPIPTVVWQVAAGATTGISAPKRIYVMGGLPDRSLEGTDLNQVYTPENDTWTSGASMPTPRLGLAIAVVNDLLYALGGTWMALNPQSPIYAANEQYTPFEYGTILDTTPPNLSIVSPENKTYSANNISLTFYLDESAEWIGYCLDGRPNVTISGNTVIPSLSSGSHSLTVYAKDAAGNIGTSEVIYFTIAQQSEPFPATLIAAVVVSIAVIIGTACIVYFRSRKKNK